MSEMKDTPKPISFFPKDVPSPLALPGGITEVFTISNGGADSKTDLRLSIFDSSGNYHRILAINALAVGESMKFDLAKFNKQAAKAKLMYRGKDGIGRHSYLEAPPEKFFSSLDIKWFVQVDDQSIEECFFCGEEA